MCWAAAACPGRLTISAVPRQLVFPERLCAGLLPVLTTNSLCRPSSARFSRASACQAIACSRRLTISAAPRVSSFFQSVCVLGYCLFPTIVSLLLCQLVLLFEHSTALFVVRLVITCLGFGWATYGQFGSSTVGLD